jgi:5-methylcytosine-specific restriction endonuclease McrA
MKTLSSLSGAELLQRTQDLVAIERRATMDLIEHLREIEKRMLFLDLGYKSLFDFAVGHLGLSEGSAQRRIAAMRLVRDVPEARAKLESGALSLSNASRVQTVFRAAQTAARAKSTESGGTNGTGGTSVTSGTGATGGTNATGGTSDASSIGSALSIDQKKEILESISGLTQKECESKLLELLPQAAPKMLERDRQVNEDRFELKMILSKEAHDKMKELQQLFSHTLKTGAASELFEILIEREIVRQRKMKPVSSEENSAPSSENISSEISSFDQLPENISSKGSPIRTSTAAAVRTEIVRSRKHISNSLRREIWKRADGCCEAKEKSGRCKSRYRLELDHIIPHARGGGDTFENLRLYCRAHNLRHAMESYGSEVMERYRR